MNPTDWAVVWEVMKWPLAACLLLPPLLVYLGLHVIEREVGLLGVGVHNVDLARGARLAPGIYLLRLTQGDQTVARRACVLN